MVLFVDLEDESEPPEITTQWQRQHLYERGLRTAHIGTLDGKDEGRRVNPNKNVMTEALGCYPYVPFPWISRPMCHLSCYGKPI